MNRKNILLITAVLVLIGLVFISVSSVSEAAYTVNDKFYFIKKQLIWSVCGFIVFYVASKIKIELLKKYANYFYYFSIFLLILLFIPNLSTQTLGAKRWLDLGFIVIQPSEILKLSSIIFFSKLFSSAAGLNIKKLIIYLGIPLVLIILEPNLSTAILIGAIVITTYYVAGGEIISLFALCSITIVISFLLVFSSPYRLARLNSLVNPDTSSNSSTYHSDQMILALTSGHITGKGFANSEQKYRYLPKISTDSILAVIGEETGFIGVALIISLYLFLILNIIKIGSLSSDVFSSLLTIGIGSWIAFQSLINISAVVALIPLTGVPLPLISYGGSSLIALMFALGLIQNINNQSSKLVYSNNSENKKNHPHHRYSPHPRH